MDKLSRIDGNSNKNASVCSLETLKCIYEIHNAAANGHETLHTVESAVVATTGDLA